MNVIYLDLETFDNQFLTFRTFPEFQILRTSVLEIENVSNIRANNFKILCSEALLLSTCIKEKNKTLGYGRVFQLVNAFGKYVNGAIEITSGNIYDIKSQIKGSSSSQYLNSFPKLMEYQSIPIESFLMLIILPKANLIDSKLYLLKPFSWNLWLACFGYIIFGSTLLTITFSIIRQNANFWIFSNQLLRSLLSQSFSDPINGLQMSVIYILALLMGFIIFTFYSAILGSFITTNLYEKQIVSLEDMRKVNMKLVHSYDPKVIGTYMGYNEIKDFAVHLTNKEYIQTALNLNSTTGFLMPSNLFEFDIFKNKYKVSDFVLEQTFVRLEWNFANFIFKERFDKFITLSKDTGLYNYWSKKYDLYKIGKSKIIVKSESYSLLRVLDLNFITYPIFVLMSGLIISGIVFVFEVFKTF